jgi:Lrp/AsnC family leucine-responsive transcriptional regulator
VQIDKISETERQILYLMLMNGRASVAELAKTVGCPAHVAQHAIKKFRDNRLLSRRVAVNPYNLGYIGCHFLIGLSGEEHSKREEVAEFLARYPQITAILEIGGEYDFFLSMITRSRGELARINQEISEKMGHLLIKRHIGLPVRHAVFGAKLLTSRTDLYTECIYDISGEPMSPPLILDDVDHQLLRALTSAEAESSASLARSLGVPASTIDYRMKRLESQGIICGDMRELNGNLLGLTHYLMLVVFKGMPEEQHAKFYNFSKFHQNITHFTVEVGPWDYMLGVAVRSTNDLANLLRQIREVFGPNVSSITPIPLLNTRKVKDWG